KFAYEDEGRLAKGFDVPLTFQATRLAQAYLDAGQLAEARRMLDTARATLQEGDLWVRTIADGTEARLLTAEGDPQAGLALARSVIQWARTKQLDRLVILFANALED